MTGIESQQNPDRDPREPFQPPPAIDPAMDPEDPLGPPEPLEDPGDAPGQDEPERRDPDPREPGWRDPGLDQPGIQVIQVSQVTENPEVLS